jgi:hypothetical protein
MKVIIKAPPLVDERRHFCYCLCSVLSGNPHESAQLHYIALQLLAEFRKSFR